MLSPHPNHLGLELNELLLILGRKLLAKQSILVKREFCAMHNFCTHVHPRANGLEPVMGQASLGHKLLCLDLDGFDIDGQKLAVTLVHEFYKVLFDFRETANLGPTEDLMSRCGLKDAVTTHPAASNG